VKRIQALQALPPKAVLSRAWWGEPLRQIAGAALRWPSVRARLAYLTADFLHGVTSVRLTA